jgi:hypothetical protein
MPAPHLTPASVPRIAPMRASPTRTFPIRLRPICERLLTTLERARGDHDRERLATRAALRHAVTAYIEALRSEGISPPWVLESVVAFARGVHPRRPVVVQERDSVEADVVRWSLAALRWPPIRSTTGDVEVMVP